MKVILIFLISIISQKLCGQEAKYLMAENEILFFFKSKDSVIINKEVTLKNSTLKDIKFVVSRDRDFNIRETIYDFTTEILLDDVYRNINFKIYKYYLKNNYCGLILNNINLKGERSKFEFEKPFYSFLIERNKYYATSYTDSDFVKQNLNSIIYGSDCGYEMKEVKVIDSIKLFDIENAEQYVNWMRSFNLELQTWDYSQLNYLLKKNAFKLDAEEIKIYNHIKNRNAVLETCSGCTFGLYERNWK